MVDESILKEYHKGEWMMCWFLGFCVTVLGMCVTSMFGWLPL